MKKRNIRLLWALASGVALATASIVSGAAYMLNYALAPHKVDAQAGLRKLLDRNPDLKPWVDSITTAGGIKHLNATIRGNRLHALWLPAAAPSNKLAVVVHGYKNNAWQMLHVAQIYSQQGYNVLLPDLYAHGESEGDHINMGWHDRLDVMAWLKAGIRLSGGDSAQAVLHGISMGAATVMSMSGEQLPPQVKCIVEDCGYTSVADEFTWELEDQFGLKPWPLIPITSQLCKWRYGWSFAEASPLRQVAKCKLPMLFIHGDNDDFVPTAMVEPLYAAKPAPKELWMGKGSAHARTITDHHAEYVRRVTAFISQWVK